MHLTAAHTPVVAFLSLFFSLPSLSLSPWVYCPLVSTTCFASFACFTWYCHPPVCSRRKVCISSSGFQNLRRPRPTFGNVRWLCPFCVVDDVYGVTQLHDVVYIVCIGSSAILRFNATTHERLTEIHVKDLRMPWDIVACEQTSQLYVAELGECVFRVSADGTDIKLWISKSSSVTVQPYTVSVTSTRLLVTSRDTKHLIQFDSDGDELRRVQLPDHMKPEHAVESPTTTFIFSHYNTQLNQFQISEVNTEGQVLNQFTGSRLLPLGSTQHIAIDSHGNVFVADFDNGHIWLLDAQLRLRRLLLDERQLNDKRPWRLCYSEPTGQLLVGLLYEKTVAVFDVLRQ